MDRPRPTPADVLIVEDDDDVRRLVERVLQRAGLVTEAVSGGLPALDAAHRTPASLIVLDVDMPDLNGLEVCRQLKADTATSALVLIVSGNATRADIAAGYQAGCDDYLPKPFTAAELVRRVRQLIPRAG